MENTAPPRINLALVQKHRRQSASPMASDSSYNASRLQLISPPPEETLRRTRAHITFTPSLLASSKRKRTANTAPAADPPPHPDITPNPKPRKQVKHHARNPSLGSPTRTSRDPSLNRVLFQSPHAAKPDADFIPPLPLSLSARSRRSATPIPPYEPPSDVFTPPREVFATPTISKSSKRKTAPRKSRALSTSREPAVLPAVKQEFPVDVDLCAPMPPPSPTDDPLLLSGPPEPQSTPTRPRKASVAVATDDDDLPPSSPIDWNFHHEPEGSTDFSITMDPADADVPPLPLFDMDLNDINVSSAGAWSDSDDDDHNDLPQEGVGEFTGKWRMVKVRTKLDPPSSATRNRMEEWGRPISPFPKIRDMHLEEDDIQEEQEPDEEAHPAHDLSADEQEEQEVRQMSVEYSPEDEHASLEHSPEHEHASLEHRPEDNAHRASPSDLGRAFSPVQSSSQPLAKRASPSPFAFASLEQSSLDTTEPLVERTSPFAFAFPSSDGQHQPSMESTESRERTSPSAFAFASPEQSSLETAEPLVERASPFAFAFAYPEQPSLETAEPVVDLAPDVHPERHLTPSQQHSLVDEDTHMLSVQELNEYDDDEDDSSDGEDIGVVKITSSDPRAAARAAAILKLHDYDCYTKIKIRQKHLDAKKRRDSHSSIDELAKESRRRGVSNAGITKEEASKRRRRSTLGMGVIGDRVVIPGSPVTTLPELLKQAEAEVEREIPGAGPLATRKSRDLFSTPVPERFRSPSEAACDVGERQWTREDWKQLDACFTDERLEAGGRLGFEQEDGMASVDLVNVDDVVARFVRMMGGEEMVAKFGDAWDRNLLLQRTRALQNKQRAGHVAPPSTPAVTSGLGGSLRRVPTMEVPDFTPLGRRAPPPRKLHSVLPPPNAQDAPFKDLQERPKKLPATLMAPRYSHLLEEAIAINEEGTHSAGSSSRHAESSRVADVSTSREQDTDERSICHEEAPPNTIGKRVKGFLFSYLPTMAKTKPTTKKMQLPRQPGLPLPPPDVLEKPRGPISTPARQPLPKPKHPKELVHLHPAPQPLSKIPVIPRTAKPQRLVELHPLPPVEGPPVAPRPRRSSGGSVKDLVKGFEEMQGRAAIEKEAVRKMEMKRMRSTGEMRSHGKPAWKP